MSTADIRMRGFMKRTPIKTLLSLIKGHSQLLSAEEILTVESCGRILAQDINSPSNVPNLIVQPWTVMHWMPNPLLAHLLTIR